MPRYLLPLGLMLLSFSACRGATSTGQPDSGSSDATGPQPCASMADCGGTGICVGGICESVVPCAQDDECSEGVCHTTRGYCVECDGQHTGECAAGSTCQFDFTCTPIGGNDAGVSDGGSCSGSCTDRTECGTDNVCVAGACCPPPSRCFAEADCPVSRPECNGATGQCFGGASCINNSDCDNQAGCSPGACECDAPSPGQPGVCRAQPDACQSDMDCFANGMYDGKVCALSASPTQCVTAANCTSDAQCSSLGLVCDLADVASPSYQRCVNGNPCNGPADCANMQVCDNNICVAENCVNTPTLCTVGQICEPTSGQCITNMLNPCPNGDSDCAPGYFCDTTVTPAAECRLGCRDNNDCPGGVCNAQNQCEGGQGPGVLCGPCNTDADCPGGTVCFENPFLGKLCYEQCSALLGQDCTINPMASCNIVYCACGGF